MISRTWKSINREQAGGCWEREAGGGGRAGRVIAHEYRVLFRLVKMLQNCLG
jgi:hypothetical protein